MQTIGDALGFYDLATLGALCGGLLLGFAVGAIPGVSSSTAVAIILPISIGMDVHTALIFMAGVYCGGQYGGAPPAILLNTPGESGAAVTALDGYPMTRRGEGARALAIARVASGVGGVLAAILVMTLFAPLSDVLLEFGAPEMFVVAVLGLSLISSIGSSDVLKGLLAASSGALVSLMAADPILGSPRVTFGIDELYDDFPFVPVLIGLFGISELAMLVRRGRVTDLGAQPRFDLRAEAAQIGAGFRDVLTRPLQTVRGSLIGMFVGIIPGAGSSISNFIAYGLAKRFSRRPETFGTGNPEGIIAAESSDNGVTAGAMVPTFGFGVPGSATTAVMLSAMLLHGIDPGPRVLTDSAPLVYSVLLGILFASILTIPLGTVLSSVMLRLVTIPVQYLVPGVLIIATMGTYSFRESAFDVLLLPVFGALGYVLRRHGYPVVAFVMGLILGPIAEGNFNRALRISGDDWSVFVESPITWVLWAATLAIILLGPISRWRSGRRTRIGAP